MIETIREQLKPTGWKVVDTDATGQSLPYFLIIGSIGDRGNMDGLCGRSFQDQVIVRACGFTPGQVRRALDYSRQYLAGYQTATDSHYLAFQRTGSRQVMVDREVTLENDAHPCWVDDEYTIYGEPVKESS